MILINSSLRIKFSFLIAGQAADFKISQARFSIHIHEKI